MKKLLTAIALAAVVTSALGQGQLTFNNSSTTLIGTNTAPAGTQGQWDGARTGPTAPAPGGTFYYALFVAPQGTTDPALFTFTGAYATNTTAVSGGRLLGGQPVIPGYAVGATGNFLVRGWSGNIGVTWADAQTWYGSNGGNVPFTGWFGASTIATVVLGGGASPVPGLFGATAGSQIGGFDLKQINPVPEPSSFALAGLGAAAMLIFRRRK